MVKEHKRMLYIVVESAKNKQKIPYIERLGTGHRRFEPITTTIK